MVTVPVAQGSSGQVGEGSPSAYRGCLLALTVGERGLAYGIAHLFSHKVGLIMPVLQMI